MPMINGAGDWCKSAAMPTFLKNILNSDSAAVQNFIFFEIFKKMAAELK